MNLRFGVEFSVTARGMESTTWDATCDICASLLVCGNEVTTLDVRSFEDRNRPLRVMHVNSVVPLGDHTYFLVRHDHEIFLEFTSNPESTPSGDVRVTTRSLSPDARPQTKTMPYVNEPARGIRIALPGTESTIRLTFRSDGRPPSVGASGVSNRLKRSLFDLTLLKKHPERMAQPANLDIPEDAPGFYMPH